MLSFAHEGHHDAPAGMTWFAAVRSFAPGVRLRAYFHSREGADCDLPEEMCQAIYQGARGDGAEAQEEVLLQIARNRL